jgi:glycosyltransferase involved in cell wall biosynthesis
LGEPTPLSAAPGASRGAVTTTFLGQVSHCPALGTVYATSDAFFSPSTCETLGQVFQESMASGLVPTGCRFGGVPEVFDHGCEGYLFEPEDTAGAAAGIARALGDRAASLAASGGGACPVAIPAAWAAAGAAGRGEAARARVLSKSWAAAYAQAESAYYRALATRWPYLPNKPLRR